MRRVALYDVLAGLTVEVAAQAAERDVLLYARSLPRPPL